MNFVNYKKYSYNIAFMDAEHYMFKQKNTMCKSFISITEVPFYSLCHHYNFIKLYPSMDSHIFQRLYANKAKKKKCYIGVTRPTLKLGPTPHFFF